MVRVPLSPQPLIFSSALTALFTTLGLLGFPFMGRVVSGWFGGPEDLGADLLVLGKVALGAFFEYGSLALNRWMLRLAHEEVAAPGPGAQT